MFSDFPTFGERPIVEDDDAFERAKRVAVILEGSSNT